MMLINESGPVPGYAEENKPPLIVIAGPTAVGKSDLAVMLSGRIGGEVISADSVQVYKGMDIGSAKITPAEQKGIRHHLLDVLSPDEPFHVVRFQQMAKEAAALCREAGHIPVLCGGTGFYIQAVLYDIDFGCDEEDPSYRESLERRAAAGEELQLHRELMEIDSQSAAAIHPNNVKRVIRALEYYHLTGIPISEHNRRQALKTSPYNYVYFALTDDRQAIYRRIDARVDEMMRQGLLEEVTALRGEGYTKDMVSMQALGYKELFACLEGETTLEEAVDEIKKGSRHFAKRQLTWLRRERDVTWMDLRDYPSREALCDEMIRIIRKRGII